MRQRRGSRRGSGEGGRGASLLFPAACRAPFAAQRGVALVTALLVVALAATAAAAMAVRQQIDIRRTANLIEYDQAYLYLLGMEDWAGQILRRDAKESTTDHLGEAWATELPPIPVEGGQLAGRMEDMQGRFNLNTLVKGDGTPDPIAVERFRRLLAALGLDPEITEAVVDWIDAGDEPRLGGAEEVEYLGLDPPYRTANGPLASISELRLVKGVSAEVYARLAPYVSALPAAAGLNVNTVAADKPELIMALADGIERVEAEQAIAGRGDEGYKDVATFLQHPAFAGKNLSQQGLTVNSGYFMVTSQIQAGRSVFTTFTLLERVSGSGASRTVMRTQGIL